ncbi:MAG: transcriptional repressor [Phycisphaeraceae bacterium]|nr:transcriptional repressor [Phycisphaeraceae bacterium]
MIDPDPSVRDLFTRHGLRCTRQREVVYAALLACKNHPTAEELFRLARGCESGLSLATVYNALDAFIRSGLCRRLPSSHNGGPVSGGCRFDASTDSHVHTVSASGQVRDLPADLSSAVLDSIPDHLLREIERRLGARIMRVGVDLIVYDDGGEAPPTGCA